MLPRLGHPEGFPAAGIRPGPPTSARGPRPPQLRRAHRGSGHPRVRAKGAAPMGAESTRPSAAVPATGPPSLSPRPSWQPQAKNPMILIFIIIIVIFSALQEEVKNQQPDQPRFNFPVQVTAAASNNKKNTSGCGASPPGFRIGLRPGVTPGYSPSLRVSGSGPLLNCWGLHPKSALGASGESSPLATSCSGGLPSPPLQGPVWFPRAFHGWLVLPGRRRQLLGAGTGWITPPRTIAEIPPDFISPILGSFLAFLPFHFIFFKGLVQIGCSTRHRQAASFDRNGERKGNNGRTGGFTVLRQL
ncbi:uncharacterized protein LOC121060011 isoform X2 [Cygnus olor]|uniref:uncharacterized protein LOC121060011 isoform X2 n=1 Tax=Cygnus olor TaxID=8869 RepID=UPI001ADE2392|nr:uncharacterized protein LOC121060011 isoform X2 [Cygnus olor]